MRVLIINDYGTLHGGAEHTSHALREGLRSRGHDALLLASSAASLPIENIADVTCTGSTGVARKLLQVANPSARLTLERTLRKFRPDIVHLRMFMTQLSPLILPALRDVPTVHHVVNYDLICPLNVKRLPDGSPCHLKAGIACHRTGCLPWMGVARGAVQSWLTNRWLGNVDRIVCNSHWVRRRLEEEGIPVSGVIWNGIPERPVRTGLAPHPLVVCASRLFPKKGIDVLLRAAARLKEETPSLRVLVAGDGPEKAALESLSARLGVQSHVQFLGHLKRERLEELFAPAWIQVVPSTWEEPFGLVVAEAQMRGTAAVVSDVGGPMEIIEEGVTGRSFRVGDSDSLARILGELIADPAGVDRMGRAGRQRALRYFREDTMVDRFLELYGEMADESKSVR
jgi:glycosyltransferase involved in cell wall biosynthesis